MSDSERTPEKLAHNEKMKLYMREYRKRRKLAKEAVQGADNGVMHTYACPEDQSSPIAPPDAN